ncbi:hypothetical protein [Brevifollis gellanilyticus]|uniref:Uncharacterized protein n=1 Tax=Brevifollis gellanilyticus TaxID=748831 RepID=A0A512MBS7_9BACT|nr:hypothetical protein [Brevifollis gellanilyticus]GEP44176.1 hypothetical protein BGE01nite_34670 [Brevifollis gellanilyticus]
MKTDTISRPTIAKDQEIVSGFVPVTGQPEKVLEGKILYGSRMGRIEQREITVQLHSISGLFASLRAVAKG